jgi:hypothetical protein
MRISVPAGSSLSLKVVAVPKTYLLKLILKLGCVLVAFLDLVEVKGIP